MTSVLQNTVEDLLALGVAGLAGYIATLGLPQKRAQAKEKLEKVAGNFAKVTTTDCCGLTYIVWFTHWSKLHRLHH